MNILYCGDRNTQRGIFMSVLSLMKHCTEPLKLYIMTMDYSEGGFKAIDSRFCESLNALLKSACPQSSARLFDCSSLFRSFPPYANLNTRFTPYCMLRLYADLLEELPSRLLYLDYDVVCCADPSDFYHQDFSGHEYVGVKDYYGRWFYPRKVSGNHPYINSGVLLMNMDYMKQSGFLNKCRRMCAEEKLFLPDQHALNKAALNVKIAPFKYNDQRRYHPDTVFRHYSTTFRFFPYIRTVTVKPWDQQRMHKLLKDHTMDKYMNKMTIPVFFTIDDNYAATLAVTLSSIIENCATNIYDYHLIILHQGLSEENKKRLSALSCEHFKVEILPMKEKFEGIESDFIGNKLRADYFTLTIYFRLFIPDMFPQYSRGIYLDSDVVVPGDLSTLFETELGDNLIAACPDYSIQEVEPLMHYVKEAVGVDQNKDYINSGVLLMDLEALRKVNFGTRFLELLNKYHFDTIAPDQDYINAMCKGRIHYLSEEWDAMPNENKAALDQPQIIHYNLFAKPWCYDGIQYADYFWKYAEKSGYIEELKTFKAAYSEEQKASDKKSMTLLVDRGQMIADSQDLTFKKVFDQGLEKRL